MTIQLIRASFECDGCGKPFKVDIDSATRAWERRQDVFSIAVDAIRGGTTADGEFCSVQDDMHLCGKCTAVADNIGDEDYTPSADEIKHALGAL